MYTAFSIPRFNLLQYLFVRIPISICNCPLIGNNFLKICESCLWLWKKSKSHLHFSLSSLVLDSAKMCISSAWLRIVCSPVINRCAKMINHPQQKTRPPPARTVHNEFNYFLKEHSHLYEHYKSNPSDLNLEF